jgi:TPR repeat protein
MMDYSGNCGSNSRGFSVPWFQMAAKQGHLDAQNMLGNIYLGGEGVIVDYQKALKWYKMAAAEGHPEAQFNLGWMYYYGRGVTKNNEIAAMCMKRASDKGNQKAKIFIQSNRLERYL